ncbi:RNA-binding protein [Schizosaccharomyces cryophilus OY26]|uniref:RNA-binding protein n=1 Tax=Schizosaccharomyces cryophilus (strain OY26 / ATCC MYA-4695 / CBS 11777 / NBRC 106824 / NRRL Y48691) TaxID=653667 RepID=S9W944_SCHCR|nr:RNA-binding protein [Schizosaccharomyces cryophilus OY26]EPY54320.1 RNA-binding protein [Schizosaccharomyces cryophilus OY26]
MHKSATDGVKPSSMSRSNMDPASLDMPELKNELDNLLDSSLESSGIGATSSSTSPFLGASNSEKVYPGSNNKDPYRLKNNTLLSGTTSQFKDLSNEIWPSLGSGATYEPSASERHRSSSLSASEESTKLSGMTATNYTTSTANVPKLSIPPSASLAVSPPTNRARTSSLSSSTKYDPSFPWTSKFSAAPSSSTASSLKQPVSSMSLRPSTDTSPASESGQRKSSSSSATSIPTSAASEIISNKDPVVSMNSSVNSNAAAYNKRSKGSNRLRSYTLPWNPRVFSSSGGFMSSSLAHPNTLSSTSSNANQSDISYIPYNQQLPSVPADTKLSADSSLNSSAVPYLNHGSLDQLNPSPLWTSDLSHLSHTLRTGRSGFVPSGKSSTDPSDSGNSSKHVAHNSERLDSSLNAPFGLVDSQHNFHAKNLQSGFAYQRPQAYGLNNNPLNPNNPLAFKGSAFEAPERPGGMDVVPELPPLGSLNPRSQTMLNSRRRSQSLSSTLTHPPTPVSSLVGGMVDPADRGSPKAKGSPSYNPSSLTNAPSPLSTSNSSIRTSTPDTSSVSVNNVGSTKSVLDANSTTGWSGIGDATIGNLTQSEPTHALWIGNLPVGISSDTVAATFASHGTITNIRMLSHKHSAFINFDSVNTAKYILEELNGQCIFLDSNPICIGFAKVASSSSENAQTAVDGLNKAFSNVSFVTSLREVYDDIIGVIKSFGYDDLSNIRPILDTACDLTEFTAQIPSISKAFSSRRLNAPKLRQVRKRIDNGLCTQEEVEEIAVNWLDEVSDLASDHLGNTVVQKLFDYCSDPVKEMMLERIAPHLAQIGIHKNGTWAAQKIVDVASTESQMLLIAKHLQPYIPLLFADQFGNYVVQTCLRFGSPMNNFVFEAIMNQFWVIAQSRYGSRAIRTCLESPDVVDEQRVLVAAAITVYSVHLAMNGNGTLLLNYLIENMNYPNIAVLLTQRFTKDIVRVCTHRLAYNSLLKILSMPQEETICADMVVEAILGKSNDLNTSSLEKIIMDQNYGPSFLCKLMTIEKISPTYRHALQQAVIYALERIEDRGSSELRKLSELCS